MGEAGEETRGDLDAWLEAFHADSLTRSSPSKWVSPSWLSSTHSVSSRCLNLHPHPEQTPVFALSHRGEYVVAGRAADLPVGAVAGLFAAGVRHVVVGVPAVKARDLVRADAVGEGDLLEALLCEREGPEEGRCFSLFGGRF